MVPKLQVDNRVCATLNTANQNCAAANSLLRLQVDSRVFSNELSTRHQKTGPQHGGLQVEQKYYLQAVRQDTRWGELVLNKTF